MLHPADSFQKLLANSTTPSADLCNAFIDFCFYFDRLTKKNVRTTIQDRQLIDVILFKQDLSNRNTFQKHIFAANCSFQRLFKIVYPSNILEHTHILKVLMYDIYPILYVAEDFEHLGMLFQWGSREDQSGREIYDASRLLFYLQAVQTKKAYLREITPVSIFLIRQALEVLGKNCIGLHSITSPTNQRYKNTQISWEFITIDQKSNAPKVKLPVDIHIINKIITWTNGYVHTGDLKEYYIIENILEILSKAFYSPIRARVMNYNGKLVVFGIVQVTNYNLLKAEFEAHVNRYEISLLGKLLIALKLKKSKAPNWRINWINPDAIMESTIVSM